MTEHIQAISSHMSSLNNEYHYTIVYIIVTHLGSENGWP
jgi:hypothetical protein